MWWWLQCHVSYPTQPLSHSTHHTASVTHSTQSTFYQCLSSTLKSSRLKLLSHLFSLEWWISLLAGTGRPFRSIHNCLWMFSWYLVPVPTSQVLRKRISSHVQGNIVNQTSVQHDPANMHPPSNLWGSSPLKGGVHPNLHCHCQPPSW